MKYNPVTRFLAALFLTLSAALICFSQQEPSTGKKSGPQRAPASKGGPQPAQRYLLPPSGTNFFIAPVNQQPGQFSMLLADKNNRTVTGQFSDKQLDVLEAMMTEAQKFAQTEEAVGTKKPIYTRFYEKREPAFAVDVGKMGNQSFFYLSMEGMTGYITIEAGAIKRGDQQPSALFYDILARIQAVRQTAAPLQ